MKISVAKKDALYVGKQALSTISKTAVSSKTELQELNLNNLVNGIAIFTFVKKDSSFRTAIGTLNPELLKRLLGDYSSAKKTKTLSITSQSFYDLEAGEWKAYQIDSLICIFETK